MAMSPMLSPGSSTGTQVVAAKARALTVLGSSRAKAVSPAKTSTTTNTNASVDLSEQLNADVARKYEKGKKLGEGTYAIVYKGFVRDAPSRLVAIKKIKINEEYKKDGMSMDSLREIKYLQELSHPNIIALLDVFSSKGQNLNLVLEFLPLGDLEGIIKDPEVRFGLADIKAWMGMSTLR